MLPVKLNNPIIGSLLINIFLTKHIREERERKGRRQMRREMIKKKLGVFGLCDMPIQVLTIIEKSDRCQTYHTIGGNC